jgi:hypothetical protein
MAAALAGSIYAAAEWKDDLTGKLRSTYVQTGTGTDRLRITRPGTIFVLQKDGVSGDLARDLTYQQNKVRDGEVAQASGFGAAMLSKKNGHLFKRGDRLYVTKMEVKDDAVILLTISCDTFDVNVKGKPEQTRYKSQITFEFPSGYLASAEFPKVKQAIETVLMPEADVKAGSTKSVELGQKPEQVTAALGMPDKIVNLGPKMIYVYKDMKIVFQDGKVSDVQ